MDIEKGVMGMVVAVMIAAVILQVLPVYAAPTVYACPICGEQFGTMGELEAHFAAAHPSEPINIIWS